ncbi:MAG: hypothetical protein ACP5KA_00005, partial [Desulfurococcaceae archaeon]
MKKPVKHVALAAALLILVVATASLLYWYYAHARSGVVAGEARSYDLSGVSRLVKFYVVGNIPSSVEQLFRSLGIQLAYVPLEGGLARAPKLEDN